VIGLLLILYLDEII